MKNKKTTKDALQMAIEITHILLSNTDNPTEPQLREALEAAHKVTGYKCGFKSLSLTVRANIARQAQWEKENCS